MERFTSTNPWKMMIGHGLEQSDLAEPVLGEEVGLDSL